MIYTDTLHVVADTLPELHKFARRVGLTRYHNYHYDLPMDLLEKVLQEGVRLRLDREVFKIAQKSFIKIK